MKKKSSRFSTILVILAVFAITIACNRNFCEAKDQPAADPSSSNQVHPVDTPKNISKMFKGTVTEMIDAGRYVYVQINTGEKLVWVAAPSFDGNPGDKVEVSPGVPIEDFQSKKLNRKFDIIYFVGGIRKEGEKPKGGMPSKMPERGMPPNMPQGHPDISKNPNMMPMTHPSMDEFAEQSDIKIGNIEKADGGQTVSEIIANRVKFAGKEIRIRAKVVKFTPNIMDKNWVHVRDGSGEEGSNDLIVTTKDTVKVGDVVLVRGIVSVDKDFGFGLKYDVIVENATVIKE